MKLTGCEFEEEAIYRRGIEVSNKHVKVKLDPIDKCF